MNSLYKNTYNSVSGHYENNTTLFISKGYATEQQLRATIDDAYLQLRQKHPNVRSDYILNYISSSKDKLCNYAFMDVSNPVFFYALCGLDINGQRKRIVIQEFDPNTEAIETGTNWADDIKYEEVEPIVTIRPITYTDEQVERYKCEKQFTPIFMAAKMKKVGPNMVADELYISNVSNKNIQFYEKIFRRYERGNPRYPRISFHQDKRNNTNVCIQFSDEVYAYSALLMCKKITDNQRIYHVRHSWNIHYKPEKIAIHNYPDMQ